jgi:hypothetical protein
MTSSTSRAKQAARRSLLLPGQPVPGLDLRLRPASRCGAARVHRHREGLKVFCAASAVREVPHDSESCSLPAVNAQQLCASFLPT